MLASSEIAVRYFRWATTEWRRIHDGDFTELLQTGMRAAEQCVAALRQLEAACQDVDSEGEPTRPRGGAPALAPSARPG